MAVAGLIVGTIALLVAVVGTYLANRRASEALAIERARRRDEEAPVFDLEYTEDEQIRLVCRGPTNYEAVLFRFGEQEHQPILGVSWMGVDPRSEGWLGSFDQGQARLFPAPRTSDEGGTARLILICVLGDYQGASTVLVECEVPESPPEPSASWM